MLSIAAGFNRPLFVYPLFSMIPALLATFLFCLSAVSATQATRIVGGISANFWRLLLATALLAIWSHLFAQGLQGQGFAMFFWSGVVGFGVGDLALYQALPRLGSRLTLLLVHCVAAPSAAFAEWLWIHTVLTLPQMACIACILLGVVVALLPERKEASATSFNLTGVIYGIIAALGQGIGAAMSRLAYDINAKEGLVIDGLTAAYQRILGGLLLAWIAVCVVRWLRKPAGKSVLATSTKAENDRPSLRKAAPWIVGTALAGPSLGVGCYQWALESTPSGLVLPVVATTPLMVIPLSAWMEGDRPTRRSIAGGLIAVLGVILLGQFR
jgi:drug/metabolite transporter (DMT)-like permease